MERRKFIIGAGALGAGISTAIGTGAFTSVEAERSFSVATAGDAEAYLRMTAADSPNAQYVDEQSDTLSVTLEEVNQNAVTTFEDLFQVSNHGTQPVGFYIEDDETEAVSFTASDSSIEGSDNAVSLDVGESAVVSVTVDTNAHSLPENYDNITVVADSSLSGTDLNDSNTVFVSQTDSAADFTSIQTAADALADRSENTVLVAGEEFDEGITVTTDGISLRSQGGTPTLNSGLNLAASDITVSGFEFTATVESFGTRPTAVYIQGTSGHDIINNTFNAPGTAKDNLAKGVLFSTNSNTTGIRIANNSFTGYYHGTYQNAQNSAEYDNNTFTDNVVAIAGVDSDSTAQIVGNVFNNSGLEAVGVNGGTAEIDSNDFNASNNAGVNNYGSTTVDAQNNWWGTTDLATAKNAINTTNNADGTVNIEPIATEPFNPATVTVEEGDNLRQKLSSARPGDTVEVTGGEFSVTSGPLEVPPEVTFKATGDVTLEKSGPGVGGGDGVVELTGPGIVSGFSINVIPDGTASRGVKLREDVLEGDDVAEIVGNIITREGDSGNAGLSTEVQPSGGVIEIRDNKLTGTGAIDAGVQTGQEVTISGNTVEDANTEGIYTYPHEADAGDLEIRNNTVTNAGVTTPDANDFKLLEVPQSVNGNSTTSAADAASAILAANPEVDSVLVQDGDGENSTQTQSE